MIIADIIHRDREIRVSDHDKDKFDIIVNGVTTQYNLEAVEVIRWLANAMHED